MLLLFQIEVAFASLRLAMLQRNKKEASGIVQHMAADWMCIWERAVGPIRSLDRAARIEAEVEVIVDRLHQFFLLVFEEVIGARDFFVMHGDMLLRT